MFSLFLGGVKILFSSDLKIFLTCINLIYQVDTPKYRILCISVAETEEVLHPE
jgi:hypothetical protein